MDESVIIAVAAGDYYERVYYDDGSFEDVPPLFPREPIS